MGIKNKDNALYFATGIDNTGLHKGREEAMGILKTMASQVTSFDIFGGVGVSAAMAFAKAAKSSYDFEKQFQQSMKEVATLSSGMKGSLTEWMNQVVSLTTQIPVSANDAAKALYQIVSAGYDGTKGMEILETAAKAAIGGVTDTATAADAITTVLNSYKMDASEAGKVSDQLFTTVKLGKTTFGELGQTISQVSPIAASFGINIEEVLAAVASLTKQGVPTAQAMTQIRAAITGAANELGDAAFEGRTFQETMQAIYDKAGGSTTKMKEMMGSIEGANAALGVTGNNALGAAADLNQLRDSTGAAEEAFKEMVDSATNQMTLLSNNITATLRPMGAAILKEVSDISKAFNTAFANGDVQKSMETMGQLIIAVTGALVGYKGSIIAVSAAKSTATIIANILHREQIKEAASLVLNKGLYAAKATVIAKNTSAHILLTNALKAQFAQMVKNTAAMMTNPYILAAAAVAALGVGLYHLATRLTGAEQEQRKFNKEQEEAAKKAQEHKQRIDELIDSSRDAALSDLQRGKSLAELRKEYPKIFEQYDIETIKLADILDLKQKINEVESNKAKQQKSDELNSIEEEISALEKRLSSLAGKKGTDGMTAKLSELRIKRDIRLEDKSKDISEQFISSLKDVDVSELDRYVEVLEKKINGKADDSKLSLKLPIDVEGSLSDEAIYQVKDVKALIDTVKSKKASKEKETEEGEGGPTKDKAYWEEQKKDAQKRLEELSDIAAAGSEGAKIKAEIEGYEKRINAFSTSKSSGDNRKQQEERINNELLALQRQAKQAEIDLMAEGSAKKIAQIELNYKNEIEHLQKLEKDWMAAQGGRLTSDQAVSLSVSYSSADNARDNGLNDIEKADNESLKELLNQYQDYSAKRLAIEEKFTKDIKALESSRTKANASEIDRAVAVANESMKNALQSLDMESFQEEIDWSMVFGDLKRIPTDGLTSLKKKLQDFIATNKDLSPENIKAVVEAIEDISTEQTERDPFSSLAASFQAMKDANALLKESQEEYNKALAQGTEEEIKNAKAKLDNANVSKQKSQSEVINSIQASAENIQEYTQAAKDILDMMDKFGVEAPEWVKESIQGLGEAVSGLESIDITKPMTIITGALQYFKGLATTLLSLGGLIPGAGESDVNLSKDIELLSQSNNDLKIAIDNLTKRMEEGSVADATDTYNQQKELLNASISNTQEMMRRSGGAYDNGVFGIGGSHSSDYKINKAISSSDWDRISSVVGKTINGASDFWNLTSEEMAKVATEASDLYTKIKNHADDGYQNASQYMDAYIEYYKELNELENQWREKLTSSSFDTIRNDFKSALMDMETDAETFAENFENLMKNAMLESMMSETYNKELQKWYESFSKSMEDGTISSSEQGDLKTEWDKIVQNALDERNAMFDAMGWDSSFASSQDQGSSRAFNAMSQETGDELSGRFTALQVTGEEIRNEVVAQTGVAVDNNRILQELYSMCYVSMSEHNEMMLEVIDILSGIKNDTGSLPRMEKTLERIEENTKNL